MENLGHFFGRLHPALVHLPIGFLLLLGALELSGLLARRPRLVRLPRLTPEQRTLALLVTAVSSVGTAVAGWLLAREGGYDAELLGRHQQLGFVVAGLSVLLLTLHLARWNTSYGLFLVVTLAALSVAGHLGGKMTHGSDYLSHYMPPVLRRVLGEQEPVASAVAKRVMPTDPKQVVLFADVIDPLLQQRCVGCHGPTKSNGNLRYDSWEAIVQGGKHGKPFKDGDAAASLMVQRIHLPLEHKEHMPPKGKPQLTENEATLLEWWIDSGASAKATLVELAPPPDVTDILAARLNLKLTEPPPDRAAVLAAAAEISTRTGVIITPLSPKDPWLDVNARLQFEHFDDAQLAQLAPIAAAIQRLDLGETAITDAGLAQVATMKNLRRLKLDRTSVTNTGLAFLTGLTQLDSLNLFGTAVSDDGLTALKPLKNLRSLYVWQTKVTPDGVHGLGEQLVDHRKVQRMEDQVADLQKKIAAEKFSVDLGAAIPKPVTPPEEKPAEPKKTP